jgi:hypothetical protein
MKKLFVLISLIMSSVAGVNAQSIQTATLVAGENTSVFYGIDGLKNAVNASLDGNTIYLSAGYFNEVSNLSKAIKIIGSGGFNPSANKNTIVNNLSITKNVDSSVDYLELEGFMTNYITIGNSNEVSKVKLIKINVLSDLSVINMNLSDIEISRCFIQRWYNPSQYTYSNVLISNCIISTACYNYPIASNSSLSVFNSIIYSISNAHNISWQNNIIVANGQSGTPIAVSNNIFTGANNFPSVYNQSGNWENVTLSDLFVNQPENKWDASYDYHLKTQENYIGTEGTQVGIYGGLFPWNPIPSNPQIISSKVEPTTTNDGKLNFQVKAEAQQ